MPEESLHHTSKIQDNFIVMAACPLFKEVVTGKAFGKQSH